MTKKKLQEKLACPLCKRILENKHAKWSVVAAFVVTLVVLLFISFWESFRSTSLWSYVPAETQQVVYVELNDAMREVLIKDDANVPEDIHVLLTSVDSLLLGQNAAVEDDFAFVLGTLREDIDVGELKNSLNSFMTTGYDYSMLNSRVFVYGTEENIARIEHPSDVEEYFVDETLAPYVDRMAKNNYNIAVLTKVTDASFVQAPTLSQGVDAMILLAAWHTDDVHGAFHVVGDAVGSTGYVEPFIPYFVDYVTEESILSLELGQFLLSSFSQEQLKQTLQTMLPMYDPLFGLLSDSEYDILSQALKNNIYVGLYPSTGTLPVGLRVMFVDKKVGPVLQNMRHGLQNIVSSFVGSGNISEASNLKEGQQGFVVNVGENSFAPVQIPVIFGYDEVSSSLSIGDPFIGELQKESKIPTYDDRTLATLRVQFDPLVEIVDQYTALMLTQMGTGVVPPTNQLDALRGKYLEGYVTTTPGSVDMYFELE